MYSELLIKNIKQEIEQLTVAGKIKTERLLASPQGPEVLINGRKVLMFASNNYLGLANHPALVAAVQETLPRYGYGLSSVRFICGTQTIHRQLEQRLAEFLGVDDAILYSSNYMANLGFFASIVNEPFGFGTYLDVIYSDELNHASIVDALKLVKRDNVLKRVYPHNDTVALEAMLKEDQAKELRHRIVATDGVFSMEGDTASLNELVRLANNYQACLFVDDAHGVGVLGSSGAGTPEALGLHGQVDVLSGTFGKALGGALGGYLAGRQEMIDFLRQKSRTYTFSNSLPPAMVMASLRVLDLLKAEPQLCSLVLAQAKYFKQRVQELGFKTLPGQHPIVPIVLGEAKLTQEMSRRLFEAGLYVVGLWFPVVPEGTARLRFQISAAHTREHLEQALKILESVGRELKVI